MNAHYHKLILLIDSNQISNFFNKVILSQAKIAKKIIAVNDCNEALDFITPKKTLNPIPDVIFLDLKTPVMSGWEFLEKYDKLDKTLKQSSIIVFAEDLLQEEEAKLNQYFFVKLITEKNLDYKAVKNINIQLLKEKKAQA